MNCSSYTAYLLQESREPSQRKPVDGGKLQCDPPFPMLYLQQANFGVSTFALLVQYLGPSKGQPDQSQRGSGRGQRSSPHPTRHACHQQSTSLETLPALCAANRMLKQS